MTEEEFNRFEFHFGVILFRTKRFQAIMDRLGKSRISKPAGWALLYLMPVAAAIGAYIFLTEAAVLLSPRGAEVVSYIHTISPLANIGLPGINPYLPIVDGWAALVVAMIVHEGAHGIVARSLGLPVKSSGLLFFLVVPIGAFVDVDEDAMRGARSSYAGRVLGAGAGINLVVAIVCLLALAATVGAFTPAASGAGIIGVAQGSPAYNAGLRPGDIVTSVDGRNVTDLDSVLGPNTTLKAGESINMTVFESGRLVDVNGVKLACCDVIENTQTGQNVSYPYIGVEQITGASLTATASAYAAPLSNIYLYFCVPTLPACQTRVPYSSDLAPFYKSSLGVAAVPLANFLYWLFFLNFNLAIFNALPIYPLDGGQAFLVGLKGLGRGRLTDRTALTITGLVTVVVLGLVLGIVIGPYLV